MRETQCDQVRHPDPGWLAAGDRRQLLEELAHRQIGVAEDVPLAAFAAIERQQLSFGDVVDVDHVHARIDVRRQASLEKIADHRAGRGRLDVADAHRKRRIHDHGVQSALRCLPDQGFRIPLALLVRTRRGPVGHRALVGEDAVVHGAHCGNAGGVDQPRSFGADGLDDVARSTDVDGDDLACRRGE